MTLLTLQDLMILLFLLCCSYSNLEGEVNTMFGPVWTMRYDTVLVSVGYFDNSYNFINQSIEIVLD